jgi:Zn-dependent M28 family amino/carboxypeptidase
MSAAQPGPPRFDGARAFRHLERVVAIGPRPAGSPGAEKTRAYIRAELQPLGLAVEEQAFDASTPLGRVPMVNLRATIAGSHAGPTLIVAGHYDTKRFEDVRFVGANDGGSSTAFLIELARALGPRRQGLPIELLFLDGEEAVVSWEGLDNTYGSRHYVQAARKEGRLDGIGALILVDMIAERNPRFPRETQSTPWLTDILWTHARRLGRAEFVEHSTEVLDDHLPFLRAGVPAVDIIDLDYAAWHTPEDTLDKLSPQGLQAVGDVLLSALPEIEKAVAARR